MTTEWAEKTVGELLEAAGGSIKTGPFGTALKAAEYSDEGTPVISTGEVRHGFLKVQAKTPKVSGATLERLSEYLLVEGDVVFARKGSVERLARVKAHEAGYFLGSDAMRLRLGTDVDSRFVAFQLQGEETQTWLVQHASGSTMPSLNQGIVARIPLLLPPLVEQRRIAAVLGAFDDLIETNWDTGLALAEAAKLEGRRMLAHFAERDEVPLTDYCAVTKGYSYKSVELLPGADTLVNLKNIGRGGVFQERGFKPLTSERFKAAQVVVPGEVVVAMTDLTQQREVVARPVRIPRVAVPGRMVASLDLAIARPRGGHTPEFLVAVLAQNHFHAFARDYSNGTTVLHMSARAFDDYRVPRIAPSEAEPFVERVGALNNAEDDLAAENADLTRVRDELLPLLMSGQIRVTEAEEALAAATPREQEVS